MSTQELLTFLFNAIALGFTIIATMDFGTRLVVAYKQVSITSNSPKKQPSLQQLQAQLSYSAIPQKLPKLPDPWLLPVAENLPLKQLPSTEFFKREDKAEIVSNILLAHKQQKHLRLLPPAKNINVSNPELEDLLRGVDLDKLKLRQARKIAKVLGIAQKVNGKDQKLEFLVSQIKSKLQQAKAEIIEVVRQELIAC
jgi:hypothetical protein